MVQDTDEILSGEWFSQILLNEYVQSLAMILKLEIKRDMYCNRK